MAVRFQLRRDTAANWASANSVLALGEPGVETDTLKVKVGDGSTAWNSLAYSITKDFTDLTSKPSTLAGYGITDSLALNALSVTQNAASGDGALTYNNATGVFSYTPPNFEGLSGNFTGSVFADDSTIMVDGVAATLNLANNTTTDLTEGTNLYYTDVRADARITNALIDEDNMASDSATKLPSQQSVKAYVDAQTTSETAEGTNLYYTDVRADARIAAASITDLSDADQTVQTTDNVTFSSVTGNVITSQIDSADSSAIEIQTDVEMLAGLTVGNHIIPSSSENIDLGSASARFRDLYLSGNSAVIGDLALKRHASGGLLVSDHSTGNPTNLTTHDIVANNITTAGYLRGPASFVIDPAAFGDDTGTVVIAGNLQVDGVQTTINSTTVSIDDLNFSIATDAADSAAANGAGITVGGAGATLNYTHATTSWDMNKPLNVTGNIGVTGTVDGVDIQTLNTTAGAALPKAGGTMTGGLSIRGFNGPVLKLGSSGAADPRIDFEDQNSTNLGAGIFLDQDADTLRILRTVSGSATDGIAINASGNVGIGITDPTAPLEVYSGEIATGANKGIRIVSNGAVKKYSIRTGITGAENTSFAIHDDTASANRLTISTTGNTKIYGMTTTLGSGTAATNFELNLDGVASKATRIQFREGVTNRWLLGQGAASETSDFELYNAAGTIALKVNRSTNLVTVANGLTLTDGNLVVASGHGIDFSAASGTGTSKLLDDYEEGTWTPVLSSDANVSSYTTQVGTYTKIGNVVTATFNVQMAAVGSFAGAVIYITGLPFNSASNACDEIGTVNVRDPASAFGGNVYLRLVSGDSYVRLEQYSGTTTADHNCPANKIDTGTLLQGSITYLTA
jgi:hypothetical protein